MVLTKNKPLFENAKGIYLLRHSGIRLEQTNLGAATGPFASGITQIWVHAYVLSLILIRDCEGLCINHTIQISILYSHSCVIASIFRFHLYSQ